MNSNGFLTWNLELVSKALNITSEEAIEYFTDGRRVSFVLERRISKEIVKGKLASSEGASYDLLDKDGKKWEVRSITKSGIYFCPSYMVGSKRSFEEYGFLLKLDEIEGYILSDVELFPNVPYWIINKNIVHRWWKEGHLGTNTKISREKALRLLKSI